MNDERIKKLPKWAREEIGRLRTRIKNLEEELDSLTGKIPDNGVYVKDIEGKIYPLPNSSWIFKRIGDGEVRLDFSNPDSIRIYNYSRNINSVLATLTVAGNCVEIRIIE
ncbi:MAG: DUF7239 family protein [Candidatus Njordarchaeia archaeon]